MLADVISTVPPSLSIDIDLYVTGTGTQAKAASDLPLQEQVTTPHTTREPSGSGEKTPESAEVGGLPPPQKGRPNVAQLVHGEINTAEGPMSVDGERDY